MGTLLTLLLGAVGGVVLLYIALLFTVAVGSVRPPRIPIFLTPGLLGEPEELVEFETEDGVRLKAWWSPGGREVVYIFFHGYLSNRTEWLPFGPRLRARGASLLFVDHRCHGTSDRAKCTFGVDEAKDVRAAVEFARKVAPGARIVLFGSSMGGASAARALSEDNSLADGLVLDGAYANLDEAARGFWYVTGFKVVAKALAPATVFGRLLLGFSPRQTDMETVYENLRGLPVLFLYGGVDTVVPRASAERCARAADADVVWFEGSGHAQGRFWEPERYYGAIVGFLQEKHLVESPNPTEDQKKTPIISGPAPV